MVVHYAGHPADMDRINAIAKKHNLKVIEDASHAQGALYKNKMCGTLGDISGTSLMGGKAFAVGEGGIVLTNNRELIEKCMLFGHYERLGYSQYSLASERLTACSEYTQFIGIPMGGVKHRMNQTCSAMGRVQLKYYPERCANINKAMNYFWDNLADLPGIRAHRITGENNSMGGWYNPRGLFKSEELDNLSCERFCEAIRAEGVRVIPGTNYPLHKHPYFLKSDALGNGRKEITEPEYLPVSENTSKTVFSLPWFKHYKPEIIDRYIAVFRKVLTNYRELL
jgi:dTDP-4-amino-4,6-dideoxygalactose transaminase